MRWMIGDRSRNRKWKCSVNYYKSTNSLYCIMKRVNVFAAAVVVILAGCTKFEVEEMGTVGVPSTIAFYNYTAGTTKAFTQVSSLSTFNATAVLTNNNESSAYFANYEVSNNNPAPTVANATHGTQYYWPAAGSMKFYGANYDITLSENNADASIVYEADNEFDLVAAQSESEDCAAHIATASPVTMSFAHLKNQVLFSAKLNSTDSKLAAKVTSVTISYPKSGTYTFSTGAWSDNTTLAETAATYYNGDALSFTGGADLAAVADANVLALIPSDADLTVTVKYTVEQTIGNITTTVADFSENGKTVTVKANQMGSKIRYNLSLPTGAAPIEFKATIESWGSATSANVTLE